MFVNTQQQSDKEQMEAMMKQIAEKVMYERHQVRLDNVNNSKQSPIFG